MPVPVAVLMLLDTTSEPVALIVTGPPPVVMPLVGPLAVVTEPIVTPAAPL